MTPRTQREYAAQVVALETLIMRLYEVGDADSDNQPGITAAITAASQLAEQARADGQTAPDGRGVVVLGEIAELVRTYRDDAEWWRDTAAAHHEAGRRDLEGISEAHQQRYTTAAGDLDALLDRYQHQESGS